jgi:hypothetical protein
LSFPCGILPELSKIVGFDPGVWRIREQLTHLMHDDGLSDNGVNRCQRNGVRFLSS